MKKILSIIIALTFIHASTFSQTQDEQKFLGTWKWKEGNRELIFFLKYDTVKLTTSFPAILGYHRLFRNDSLIQDFIPIYLPELATYRQASFVGLIVDNSQQLTGSIFDKEMNKTGRLYLTFIYPNKLKFELMSLNASQGKGAGFSLPTGIILTKQP